MNIDHFFSGTISGIFQTVIGHPFDTLKILKQNNKDLNKYYSFKKLYGGVSMPLLQTPIICGVGFYIDKIANDYAKNHFYSGAISGVITSLLISPFEYYKINLQQRNKTVINLNTFLKSYRHLHLVVYRECPAMAIYFGSYYKLKDYGVPLFFSGGISGIFSWLITYPIDTVKSRIQGNLVKSIPKAIKMGNIFNGIGYCLLRAFIVNSIGFTAYEYFL